MTRITSPALGRSLAALAATTLFAACADRAPVGPRVQSAGPSSAAFLTAAEEAAEVALGTLREEAGGLEHVRLVRFVLHSASDLEAHERVLSELE